MVLSSSQLRIELRRAGIANAAVDAVWPQWWSSDAEASLSASAELTFTVARRLGLAPQALLDGEAKFVWRDETKFKHLTAQASSEEEALSSFGFAVARVLLAGTESALDERYSASQIRDAILQSAATVDATSLFVLAWGIGVPVIQLRVFPVARKRMHAMSIGIGGRSAILLARAESYAAPSAFTLAHELGHIMLGHLDGGSVIDLEAPLQFSGETDGEEAQADSFALEVLTGQEHPVVLPDQERFSATQLAAAAMAQADTLGIEPGVLAMCAGHTTGKWDRAYGALKIIPPGNVDMPSWVNGLARQQVRWDSLAGESQDYLLAIMGQDLADV